SNHLLHGFRCGLRAALSTATAAAAALSSALLGGVLSGNGNSCLSQEGHHADRDNKSDQRYISSETIRRLHCVHHYFGSFTKIRPTLTPANCCVNLTQPTCWVFCRRGL